MKATVFQEEYYLHPRTDFTMVSELQLQHSSFHLSQRFVYLTVKPHVKTGLHRTLTVRFQKFHFCKGKTLCVVHAKTEVALTRF